MKQFTHRTYRTLQGPRGQRGERRAEMLAAKAPPDAAAPRARDLWNPWESARSASRSPRTAPAEPHPTREAKQVLQGTRVQVNVESGGRIQGREVPWKGPLAATIPWAGRAADRSMCFDLCLQLETIPKLLMGQKFREGSIVLRVSAFQYDGI